MLLSEICSLSGPGASCEDPRDRRLMDTKGLCYLVLIRGPGSNKDCPRGVFIDSCKVRANTVVGAISKTRILHVFCPSTGDQMVETEAKSNIAGMSYIKTRRQSDSIGVLVVPTMSSCTSPVGVSVLGADSCEFD